MGNEMAIRDRATSGWRGLVLLAVAAGGISGCATLAPVSPEEASSARAHAYWQAVIAKDWEKAYSFATAGYRQAVDQFNYRRRHDSFVKYERAEVLAAKCEMPDVCQLKVRLQAIVAIDRKEKVDKVVEERWIMESGDWYRYIGR